MELLTGRDVDVLGQINVDNKPAAIVKLPSPAYIMGTLVTMVVLPMTEFKDHMNARSAESIKAEDVTTP